MIFRSPASNPLSVCPKRPVCGCICLLLLAFAAGCGSSGIPTYAVQGEVLVDGNPVEQGDILFVPLDGKLAPEGMRITRGKFSGKAKAGPNRIEITALEIGPDTVYVDGVPLAANFLPECYNRQSILEEMVERRHDNTYRFQLERGAPQGKAQN